jgi:hypothetical protein
MKTQVMIVGTVCKSSPYLTSGRVYDVLSDGNGLEDIVSIIDDEGDEIMILTEHSSASCAHLGRDAKAVFV